MKKTCILIPGNPAVAKYYQSWIEETQQKNSEVDITYSTSYVLFDRKLNYIQYDTAMRNHHESCFLKLSASEKVTIIAHSVGSYFALNLLAKYPDKIEKVIIMFPYIGYDTLNILRFAAIPYMLDRFFPVVEAASFFRRAFKIWDNQVENISFSELRDCLRFGIRQCTYFNKYKFDTNTVSQYKEKIHFFYTQNDHWCPNVTIELLKPISLYQEIAIPHDFIVSRENRDKMTEKILPLL